MSVTYLISNPLPPPMTLRPPVFEQYFLCPKVLRMVDIYLKKIGDAGRKKNQNFFFFGILANVRGYKKFSISPKPP